MVTLRRLERLINCGQLLKSITYASSLLTQRGVADMLLKFGAAFCQLTLLCSGQRWPAQREASRQEHRAHVRQLLPDVGAVPLESFVTPDRRRVALTAVRFGGIGRTWEGMYFVSRKRDTRRARTGVVPEDLRSRNCIKR